MSATTAKPAKPAATTSTKRKRRPRRKLPNPAEQMLENLTRFKREGWTFELAWDRAWRSIRWPDKREPRDEWKTVLCSGRSIWESCYHDEGGPPLDIAVVVDAISRETDLTIAA